MTGSAQAFLTLCGVSMVFAIAKLMGVMIPWWFVSFPIVAPVVAIIVMILAGCGFTLLASIFCKKPTNNKQDHDIRH